MACSQARICSTSPSLTSRSWVMGWKTSPSQSRYLSASATLTRASCHMPMPPVDHQNGMLAGIVEVVAERRLGVLAERRAGVDEDAVAFAGDRRLLVLAPRRSTSCGGR